MIDPVSANGVQPARELYDLSTVDTGPGQVATADQQRFEALLGPDRTSPVDGQTVRVAQAEDVQTDGVRAADVQAADDTVWFKEPTAETPQQPLPPTIGESVLNGLEHLRNSWRDTANNLQVAVNQPEFQPADLMKIQFEVQHTAVVTSLVVNEVTALDQEVSQLMKAS